MSNGVGFFVESGEVRSATKAEIVDCASKFQDNGLKLKYLNLLNNGINEGDARELRSQCRDDIISEKLKLETESAQKQLASNGI